MLLNDKNFELVAERFRVLADPVRLRILNALTDGERSVAELVRETEATQANVSKHLGVLLRGGLVSRRKEGLYVYYACADRSVYQICDVVCGSLRAWLSEGLAQFDAPAPPAASVRPRRKR